jgi:hypothetical protein
MPLLEDIGRLAIDVVQYVVKYQARCLLVPSDEQMKHIERCVGRAFCRLSFLTFSLILLLAGIGLIIAGAYTILAAAIGSGFAALIVGVIVSLLAAILLMTIKSSMR